MKVIKNKIFAIIVLAVVILGAICFSTNYFLAPECNKVSKCFYDDTLNDINKSINTNLIARQSTANNIMIMAKKYIPSDDEVIVNLDSAMNGLNSAKTPSTKYTANGKLSEATDNVYYSLMNNYKLNSNDSSDVQDSYDNFNMLNDNIRRNNYNQKVEELYIEMLKIPANFVSKILGIAQPEFYR